MENAQTELQATQSVPLKPQGWLLPIGILLALSGLAIPAGGSWLAALSHRGWQENMMPILTLGVLSVAWAQCRPDLPATFHPNRMGFALLLLAALTYLLGTLLSIRVLCWSGFLLVLGGVYWGLLGFRAFYRRLPLFLFSFFLLPQLPVDLQAAISLPLQLASTFLASSLAGLLIPIQSEGNIFYIHGQAYEVTVACSGLNTWIAFLFAGLLWQVFGRVSLKALLVIFAGAPMLALATNTIRLLITAFVAYWISPDAGMSIHTNLGYALFPMGVVLMGWMIHHLDFTQGTVRADWYEGC